MSTWLTNTWYVAAWDREVDSQPFARTICGVPMMFYRKLDRGVVAMRDACPHRGMPPSAGRGGTSSWRATERTPSRSSMGSPVR